MSKTTQKSAKTKDVRMSAENSGPTNSSHAHSAHDHILSLQQSLGNNGVGRLLQLNSNQAGVSVGPTGDRHEHQAERFSEKGQGQFAGAGLLLPTAPAPAPAPANSRLASEGQPLPETLRESLEVRFGHDLSQVRVHTSRLAAESAKSINASAFTVGQDVVFGAGQYAPETSAGQRLIAHETKTNACAKRFSRA